MEGFLRPNILAGITLPEYRNSTGEAEPRLFAFGPYMRAQMEPIGFVEIAWADNPFFAADGAN